MSDAHRSSASRAPLTVAVVGPHRAGKSTLIGRLVEQQLTQVRTEQGLSFRPSMHDSVSTAERCRIRADLHPEEHRLGYTVDLNAVHLPHTHLTLLNSAGLERYRKSAISALSFADAALVVVSISVLSSGAEGERMFEQLLEWLELSLALDIRHFVVALSHLEASKVMVSACADECLASSSSSSSVSSSSSLSSSSA
eukprot:CAMPEP_0174236124 /NCGR_PEP_ID=MMETSP0417-20130205/5354_1 /TAXON_ID=242541 /ORGANISM="Mayorella sp, Strain BSH-02190019" /LENGTH=196 /DNA_ID=CAMNT_0015314721 /DNA_START=179 /DNA_END=765 /DNA_ORIENTATION=+